MEAGLPNITGAINGTVLWVASKRGCFSNSLDITENYTGTIALTKQISNIDFNASLVSSVYGNSSTVTPLSLFCKFYIHY